MKFTDLPSHEEFTANCAYWYKDSLKKANMLIPVTVTCDEGRPIETFTIDVPLDSEAATVADYAAKTLPPNPVPKGVDTHSQDVWQITANGAVPGDPLLAPVTQAELDSVTDEEIANVKYGFEGCTWDYIYLNGVRFPPAPKDVLPPNPYFDSEPPGGLIGQAEVRISAADWEKLNAIAAPPVPVFMSTDSATRKLLPVSTGVLKYFPDALMCVAWVSRVSNEKHNPGMPVHWDKSKSGDEKDAEVRHLLDALRGLPPDPGLEPLGDLGHLASKAWRALADLQRGCDDERKKYDNATKGQTT